MNNIIVRETCGEIRAIARGALSGRWPASSFSFLRVLYYDSNDSGTSGRADAFASYTYYAEAIGESLRVSYVQNLYTFVLSGAFSVGLCSFLLAFFRKKDGNPAHIFNGFEVFPKAFCLYIVQSFFIFLWSLLFVIPGIIAAVRYSQAFFILADNPGKGVMQCMRETKMIMTGNKGKYFLLMLSFVGWTFLAILPSVFLPIPSGILGLAVDLIYGIPYFAALAYVNLGRIVFYDLATGHLMARGSGSSGETGNSQDDNYYF